MAAMVEAAAGTRRAERGTRRTGGKEPRGGDDEAGAHLVKAETRTTVGPRGGGDDEPARIWPAKAQARQAKAV
jgi:hypothetical protein